MSGETHAYNADSSSKMALVVSADINASVVYQLSGGEGFHWPEPPLYATTILH